MENIQIEQMGWKKLEHVMEKLLCGKLHDMF